ncbi:peptidoglycan bridge formation glycyltransferase FemA/FemB family protein [Candidatus Parcubacteria bacterium]|nr:MAG: peptidoglycan bridge formation glycyltransferase FemA/FemB family protein [Candidatus Parcubacteria bacterium]
MKKFIDVDNKKRKDYNKVATHPLQSFEWGEFRKVTGIKVIRRALVENNKIIDGFTLTIHKIPYLPYFVGYLPKGNFPKKEILDEIQRIGKEEKCIFIQLEPNIIKFKVQSSKFKVDERLRVAFHPLFTKYTFVLDLTRSEEELLAQMQSKTRYNVRLAQKKGVFIEKDNSKEAFNNYLNLTQETTTRQRFYAHTPDYHKLLWETICLNPNPNSSPKTKGAKEEIEKIDKNRLAYHLLNAKHKADNGSIHTLVSWVLFTFQDTLYYPYGASSSKFKEVMASNLIAWEAIKLGKRLGLKKFDMWGAMGPEPDTRDPWYGFHRFKQGYGGELTEFIGSYDLIINPVLYNFYKGADKTRWALLKLNKLRGR